MGQCLSVSWVMLLVGVRKAANPKESQRLVAVYLTFFPFILEKCFIISTDRETRRTHVFLLMMGYRGKDSSVSYLELITKQRSKRKYKMEARERVQCCCPPKCTFWIVIDASIEVKHVFFILMNYD